MILVFDSAFFLVDPVDLAGGKVDWAKIAVTAC